MRDDDVLALLGRALAPEQREPPVSSVLALRRAVDGGAGLARSRWWHHRVAAAGAVFAAVMTASTTAFALNGAVLPRPIRIVTHGVGLPVDSAALADTRAATGELREALQHHDQARVPQATRLLRTRLSHLDQDEKREVEHEAAALLTEADQFGQQGNGNVEGQGGNASPKHLPVPTPGVTGNDQGSGGHGTPTQTTRVSPTTPSTDGRGGEGDGRGADGQGRAGAMQGGGPAVQPAPQPPFGPTSHGDSGGGGDSRPASSGPSGGHAEAQPAGG